MKKSLYILFLLPLLIVGQNSYSDFQVGDEALGGIIYSISDSSLLIYDNTKVFGDGNHQQVTEVIENANLNGYSDWYVPNSDELLILDDYFSNNYQSLAINSLLEHNWYWSSSVVENPDSLGYGYCVWIYPTCTNDYSSYDINDIPIPHNIHCFGWSNVIISDGSQSVIGIRKEIIGCMFEGADNYNPEATMQDASCIIQGCSDVNADNYSPYVNLDNGTCLYSIQHQLSNGSSIQDILDLGHPVDSIYGKFYEGGYVFHLNETNEGGLVLSPEAGLYEARWENYTNDCNGCQGESIGTGYSNNIDFINSRNNISDTYAIPYCQNYTYLDYDDWFIPSIEEGITLIENLEINNIISSPPSSNSGGGFWTSSELQDKNLMEDANGAFNLNSSGPTYLYLSNGTYSLSTNGGATSLMKNAIYPIRKFGSWVEGCMNQDYIEYNSQVNFDNGTCSELIIQNLLNNGSTPEELLSSGIEPGYFIGLNYAGGTIAHINPNDGRTLILSPLDTELSSPWRCSDEIEDMSLSVDYFSGAINQFEILDNCTSFYYPALYIDELVSGGFDDWIYPTSSDFTIIRNNLALKSLGDFELNADNYRYYVSDAGFVDLFINNAPVYFESLLGNYYKNRAVRLEGNWERGCLDSNAVDYNPEALAPDSCNYVFINGCMNELYHEFNGDATLDDGTCETLLSEVLDSLNNELAELSFEATTSLSSLQQALDIWNTTIDLSAGWNMFGYGCPSSIDMAEGLSNHTESINIVKDNSGSVYMPEFSFNGIGDLTPGFGYQIKVTEAIEGFSLCDWYVNDIPEDNIVSLQEENAFLQDNLISFYIADCIEDGFCGFDVSLNDCYYPEQGYYCNGELFPNVGDFAFGGIVFYIDSIGHGLVAASFDAGVVPWGCYGPNNECSIINGADSEQIGDGYQNTLDIIASCSETPIAASISLEFESMDYSDWYLPSQQELSEMYYSIGSGSSQGNIGSFNLIVQGYWSSTKYQDFENSWVFNFWDGSTNPIGTNNSFAVRPIRSF